MENKKVKRVKFFPEQYNAFNFSTQFGAVIAGVQSGKTFVGSYWAAKKIQEYAKEGVGAIIAPTYKILRQSTLTKFFSEFPSLRRYYKEQKGELLLPTGEIVYIRSADNPLGLEGMTLNWWWLDEGGQVNRLVWTILRSRVSTTGGQGMITTTPYNMGWLYRDFYMPWKSKIDDSLSVFGWRSVDSPYFSKEFYEQEKKRLRPEEFARRYMGEFRKMEGIVYDLPQKQIIEPNDIKARAEARIIGVDWGFRNPAAIGVYYKYDNVWYVVDEWKRTEKTTAEIIEVLKAKQKEHRVADRDIYPDPAEPDRIEECWRAGIKVNKGVKKDIKGGISYIQQLIRDERFYVFSSCKDHLDEIETYHYPEEDDGKPAKDEPVKENDHLMDAMRYAIFTFSYGNREPQWQQPIEAEIKPYYPELGI